VIAKPTVDDLGIDPDAQVWQRSGDGAGAIEIAFVRVAQRVPCGPGVFPESAAFSAPSVSGEGSVSGGASVSGRPGDADWILMRVTDDPDRRVLVFDRNEWESFLDGARKGEFDDAVGNAAS
jgi:hypothetical protein